MLGIDGGIGVLLIVGVLTGRLSVYVLSVCLLLGGRVLTGRTSNKAQALISEIGCVLGLGVLLVVDVLTRYVLLGGRVLTGRTSNKAQALIHSPRRPIKLKHSAAACASSRSRGVGDMGEGGMKKG